MKAAGPNPHPLPPRPSSAPSSRLILGPTLTAHQVPRYLGYLRLLFEAMGSMPKVDNVLWRGIAADLYDTYEEGKVSPRWRGRAYRAQGPRVGLQPAG